MRGRQLEIRRFKYTTLDRTRERRRGGWSEENAMNNRERIYFLFLFYIFRSAKRREEEKCLIFFFFYPTEVKASRHTAGNIRRLRAASRACRAMYRRWYVWGIGSFVRIICMLIAGPVIGQSARCCSHGEKRLLINVQRRSRSRECASENEGINIIREENSRLCLVGVRTLSGELENYATRGRSELITHR